MVTIEVPEAEFVQGVTELIVDWHLIVEKEEFGEEWHESGFG